MDEHVAKVVTDLSFGTGCWPCGRIHGIGGHVVFDSHQTLEEFQKKALVNTGSAYDEARTYPSALRANLGGECPCPFTRDINVMTVGGQLVE